VKATVQNPKAGIVIARDRDELMIRLNAGIKPYKDGV
jgi:hypothetical protein